MSHRYALVTFLKLTLVLLVFAASACRSGAEVKNVLFLISDDLKASVLGCYGDKFCKAPNIDRLAAEGMVFDRAYCQGTVCGPSRTSFMYSRYRHKGHVTLGQHFKDNGYYSARVGKIFHMRVPGDIIAGTNGDDVEACWTERFNSQGQEAHTPGEYACLNLNIFTTEEKNRESTRMPNRMFVSVQYEGDGSDQPDHKSATKAMQLLNAHRTEPFFLAVGFVRPHYPMVAPYQYFKPYPWETLNVPHVPDGDLKDIPKLGIASRTSEQNGIAAFPDNQRRMWQAYYASVQFMDEQVGRVISELERLGLRETTAIVFTSDHGYHLGEHTFWQKNNLHEEVLRVPLVMSVPGTKPGRTNSIVELVDIYPTLTELTGLPRQSDLHGKSLVPVLRDPSTTIKPAALSFAKGGVSLRTDDWTFNAYKDDTAELYDMRADPDQFTNLADSPQHSAIRKKLASELTARLKQFETKER